MNLLPFWFWGCFFFGKDAAMPVDNNKQSCRACPVIFYQLKLQGLINTRKIKEDPNTQTLQREIIAPLSGDCRFSWFTSQWREIDGEMTGHVLHVKYFTYI